MTAPAGVGHNSGEEVIKVPAADLINSFVNRANNLIDERVEINEQLKEVYAEAKGHGLDSKILRKVVARSRMDKVKLAEEEALLDLYLSVVTGLPLAKD